MGSVEIKDILKLKDGERGNFSVVIHMDYLAEITGRYNGKILQKQFVPFFSAMGSKTVVLKKDSIYRFCSTFLRLSFPGEVDIRDSKTIKNGFFKVNKDWSLEEITFEEVLRALIMRECLSKGIESTETINMSDQELAEVLTLLLDRKVNAQIGKLANFLMDIEGLSFNEVVASFRKKLTNKENLYKYAEEIFAGA